MQRPNQGPLGIVAGGGKVPIEAADAVRATGRDVYILAIDPSIDPEVSRFPHDRISIGQIGRMIQLLRTNKCGELLISGGLSRPDLRALKIDFGFFRHLPKIIGLMRGGDDHVLRRVIRFFEGVGFRVLGIPDVAPNLLAPQGTLANTQKRSATEDDIACGLDAILKLGAFDIGQAVIVQNRTVIAIEAVEGTDGMLTRLAEESSGRPGPSTVLIKTTKPGQELRIDLPTIGPQTIEKCKAANIEHIVLEADRSVIAERELTRQRADAAGISLEGVVTPATPKSGEMPSLQTTDRQACLTRAKPAKASLPNIKYAVNVAHQLAKLTPAATLVSSRQQALAIGIDEPVETVVRRAATLKQWSDKRRRRRLGAVVVAGKVSVSASALEAVAKAGFAGLVLADSFAHMEDEAKCIAVADKSDLFILGEQ